jgi:hypothetical protein
VGRELAGSILSRSITVRRVCVTTYSDIMHRSLLQQAAAERRPRGWTRSAQGLGFFIFRSDQESSFQVGGRKWNCEE